MRILSIFVFVLIASLPLACSKGANQTQDSNSENLQAGSTSDDQITSSIQSKFAGDSSLDASKIEVATENGLVTLHGIVPNQAQADRAVDLAGRIDGVRMVRSYLKTEASNTSNNNIPVSPAAEVHG